VSDTLTSRTLAGLPISKVVDAHREGFINILAYGASGVGKTVFAGSSDGVPEMRPVLFVDLEGGTLPLVHFAPGIDKIRIPGTADGWQKLQEVYDALRRGSEYRTVVIDSITEMQKTSMYYIMRQLKIQKPERAEEVPDMREWGINLEQTRRMIRAFRDLPMNVVFVALSKEEKDNKGKRMVKPSLTGKMADEIAAFLDVVVFLYKKQVGNETIRALLTASSEEHVAKDRSTRLPNPIQDPTMKKLYYSILGIEDTGEITP